MSSPSIHPILPRSMAAVSAAPPSAPDSAPTPPASFTGKRAATRHRLMDACEKLIVRDGFESVSMTSVAIEAGITRQTVYRYFPNAREVVRVTLLRAGRELLEGQVLVFQEEGEPGELIVEAVMAALGVIRHNALLRTAWESRDYPQAILRSIFDPAFVARGVEGLQPIARKLHWEDGDTREAYEIIARAVMSFLTLPPPADLSDDEIRRRLTRRLLPALGV